MQALGLGVASGSLHPLMETRAPAVVAVVVTTGPAPYLAETLASLAAQDYDQFSVLVLANGETTGVAELVAEALPSAFLRVLEDNRGFAAACNETLGMVEGAAFLCFCHDDVVLAEDVLHQLVEEAYRSNAGVVAPKVVRPDDGSVLLHLGLNADRFGATTERVEPGEIDHGQHDTARDVFVAPGGVTLVRADLFETLGGFDDSIIALGEDLDLCWRSLVAGSRVVVAPDAVVAHHELLANGARALTADAGGHGSHSLQSLTRRHRLSTMLTCYGWLYILPTIALLVVLETAEILVAAFGRDRERIGAVVGSWRWCLSSGSARLRRRHRQARRMPRTGRPRRAAPPGRGRLEAPDVRDAPCPRGGRRRARRARSGDDRRAGRRDDEPIDHTVGFGAAFSDDASFDELDDLGRRERGSTSGSLRLADPGRPRGRWSRSSSRHRGAQPRRVAPAARRPTRRRSTRGGTRGDHFFATWSPVGVGTRCAGHAGLRRPRVRRDVRRSAAWACCRAPRWCCAIPLGAIGIWRLLRPVGSNRARLVGRGRVRVPRARAEPRRGGPRRRARRARAPAVPAAAAARRRGRRARSPRHPRTATRAVAGSHVADDAARPARRASARSWPRRRLDPAVGVAFLVAAIGLVARRRRGGDRAPGRPVGVALAALGGRRGRSCCRSRSTRSVAGPSGSTSSARPRARGRCRGSAGSSGSRSARSGRARCRGCCPPPRSSPSSSGAASGSSSPRGSPGWALASLAVSLLVARHLTGSFAPDVSTLLVPYASRSPMLVGMGVAAFEQDVAEAQFGWRQLVAALTMLVVAVGTVPFVASVSTGRFDLPQQGYDVQLGSLPTPVVGGVEDAVARATRGRSRSASWPIEPGLAYATATNGLPGGQTLFVPPSSGAAQRAVRRRRRGHARRDGPPRAAARHRRDRLRRRRERDRPGAPGQPAPDRDAAARERSCRRCATSSTSPPSRSPAARTCS